MCEPTSVTEVGGDIAGCDHPGQPWSLLLLVIPLASVAGNSLVVLALRRERALRTPTNFYIASLAVADFLVAAAVMPFAVYYQVNGTWGLPLFVCDMYFTMDVICSTSSIFNLVAISTDRYMAVIKPISYCRHKNMRRVWTIIAFVWVSSSLIGAPLMMGLNKPEDGLERSTSACVFYNSDFILYSSLLSFFVPCSIMSFLYFKVFQVLRTRSRKARRAHRRKQQHAAAMSEAGVTAASTMHGGGTTSVGTELADTHQPAHTSGHKQMELYGCAGDNVLHAIIIENASVQQQTESGGQDPPSSPADCAHVVVEAQSQKCCLSAPYLTTRSSTPHESSFTEDSSEMHVPVSERREVVPLTARSQSSCQQGEGWQSGQACQLANVQANMKSGNSRGHRKFMKKEQAPGQEVSRVRRKKRDRSYNKRERKATKTLAIVLCMFLLCWTPFFTCNITDAICMKLQSDCSPGLLAFFLTTWLGYFNSLINPIIYTIFNPDFRRAFIKIIRPNRIQI